ncbi:putative nuclease HARBI1 [Saccostrea echinata]|uniref:putative nuclease HARBI1 n=1 Tax=Saccostrea echinata TaxID=191078 RepID=UPI002A836959|nr:putative nuclease HARBI1 [Saccostrea echinata]
MAVRLALQPPQRKKRCFRAAADPLQGWSDEELHKRYRFSRRGIAFIVELLSEDLERATKRSHALSVEQQILMALRFYASGSFLQVIGDTIGFEKSTVSKTVKDVTNAIADKAGQFIKWPVTQSARATIKTAFYQQARFPNVIGCIDGTHVRIVAPSNDENAYVNRKGYHSLNIQAVCDHEGRFTNVNASWPGSVHDAHIFRTSQIRTYMEDEDKGGFDHGILLGDSGYACRPFLLTPYLNPQNEAQERFNRAHGRTRSQIERAFGRLKRKFHVLHSEVRMKPHRVCKIVIACAVLHNISLTLGEPEDEEEPDQEDIQPPQPPYQGQQDGRGIRDYVTRHYFSRA